MYSTTTRHSQKMSVAYRLMVPNHPVMQVAPDPHAPTPPSGATALTPTYPPTAAIRHQPNSGTVSKQRLMPGTDTETLDVLIDRIGTCLSYESKARIFHENDPADKIYKVVSGLVCTCKFLSDGRRPICGFYLPGNYFGFECSGTHSLSAAAVTNAQVRVIKKSVLAAVANRDAIEPQLLLLATRELARLQERAPVLIKNAQERVGDFILEMEKRAKVGNSIQLPMTRKDVADYLGLTIETVSRILTSLENCAAIEIPTSHRIVLRSHSVLTTVTGDRSKRALSTPSSKRTVRKRSLRRCHSVRSTVIPEVPSEAV